MALIKCPECGNQTSDQANFCTNCGWKPPKFKWWLWIPLGLVGLILAMVVIGSLEPEYKRQAMEVREICKKISVNHAECDRIYSVAISNGEYLTKQKTGEAKAGNKK